MWTSDTGAPYIVLTAHWVNNEWNLKHTIIAFQRLPYPHTGMHIQNVTFKILQDFSIATKALTITIDNGANQVAAMRLLSNTAIINAIVSVNNEFEELGLNENEWKETKLFCDFLKPFFEFTVAMSGSEYPTLGTLLLFLDYLLDHLNTTIQDTESQLPTWIKNIAKAMKQKFDSLSDNLNNSAAYLTLILDPRYKTQIIPNDLDLEMAKNVLTTEFTSYQILVEQDKEINEKINKETNTSVREKRKLLGIMKHIIQKKKKSNNLQSHNKIDKYLAIPVESQNVNSCK